MFFCDLFIYFFKLWGSFPWAALYMRGKCVKQTKRGCGHWMWRPGAPFSLVSSPRLLYRGLWGSPRFMEHSLKTLVWMLLFRDAPHVERQRSPPQGSPSFASAELGWQAMTGPRGCHRWQLRFHDIFLSLPASFVYLCRFPLGMNHALRNDRWPQCG